MSEAALVRIMAYGMNKKTDRQADRRTGRQTDRQTDTHIDGQKMDGTNLLIMEM